MERTICSVEQYTRSGYLHLQQYKLALSLPQYAHRLCHALAPSIWYLHCEIIGYRQYTSLSPLIPSVNAEQRCIFEVTDC
eukprot:785535-Pyramimonas_sp.AAC.2